MIFKGFKNGSLKDLKTGQGGLILILPGYREIWLNVFGSPLTPSVPYVAVTQ